MTASTIALPEAVVRGLLTCARACESAAEDFAERPQELIDLAALRAAIRVTEVALGELGDARGSEEGRS